MSSASLPGWHRMLARRLSVCAPVLCDRRRRREAIAQAHAGQADADEGQLALDPCVRGSGSRMRPVDTALGVHRLPFLGLSADMLPIAIALVSASTRPTSRKPNATPKQGMGGACAAPSYARHQPTSANTRMAPARAPVRRLRSRSLRGDDRLFTYLLTLYYYNYSQRDLGGLPPPRRPARRLERWRPSAASARWQLASSVPVCTSTRSTRPWASRRCFTPLRFAAAPCPSRSSSACSSSRGSCLQASARATRRVGGVPRSAQSQEASGLRQNLHALHAVSVRTCCRAIPAGKLRR